MFGSPIPYTAAAEWVGWGSGPSDLFQSGTDSESFSFLGWTISIYWMWIEALPYAPWAVTNFPIDPGDQIRVTIFLADANGTTWFNEPRGGGADRSGRQRVVHALQHDETTVLLGHVSHR